MMYTDSSLNKEWQKLIKDPGCMHSTLLASGNYIVRSNKSFFLRELLKIELEASAKSLPEMGFFFFYFEWFCWLWRQLLKQDKRTNQSKYYIPKKSMLFEIFLNILMGGILSFSRIFRSLYPNANKICRLRWNVEIHFAVVIKRTFKL